MLSPTMNERRIVRSTHRSEALELMLEACRWRNSLKALLVSNEQGVLLAGVAEDGVDLGVVAAALPGWPHNVPVNDLNALPFTLERDRLYVGSIGVLAEVASTLAETANNARRILTA